MYVKKDLFTYNVLRPVFKFTYHFDLRSYLKAICVYICMIILQRVVKRLTVEIRTGSRYVCGFVYSSRVLISNPQ